MSYLLGIDGGATGTVAVLATLEGEIQSIAHGAASNYLTVGRQGAKAAFESVIGTVLAETGLTVAACEQATFGLSGLNHPNDQKAYQEITDSMGLAGKTLIENDILIAWAGATLAQPGMVVIAGTGSSCFGVNTAGQSLKTLGWDYMLADQGSGYWIGKQGLLTAFKVFDGRITDSLLMQAMVAHYGLEKPSDMQIMAHQPDFDKGKIASFARRVTQCAEQGDVHALSILQQAAEELSQAVLATARQLSMKADSFPLGLIGGVFKSNLVVDTFSRLVLAEIPGARIAPAHYPAPIGALILGEYRRQRLTPDFLQNIAVSSAAFVEKSRWKAG